MKNSLWDRKVDVRLPGKGNSNPHSVRPVHLIITILKWIRTSRSSIKNSLAGRVGVLRRNVQRFRGGLVCKAHRLLHHSTLGLRVITKKKVGVRTWVLGGDFFDFLACLPKCPNLRGFTVLGVEVWGARCGVWGVGCGV